MSHSDIPKTQVENLCYEERDPAAPAPPAPGVFPISRASAEGVEYKTGEATSPDLHWGALCNTCSCLLKKRPTTANECGPGSLSETASPQWLL